MKTKSLCRRIVSGVVALAAALSFSVASLSTGGNVAHAADTVNDSVVDARNAIVQIELWYRPTNQPEYGLHSGTAFLVNNNTLLTCSHVINLDPTDDYDYACMLDIEDIYGEYDPDYLAVDVVVLGDVTERVTVMVDSPEYDYAILKVPDNTLNTKTPLKLTSAKDVAQTQEIYALGFPGVIEYNRDNTRTAAYSTEDVTVSKGTVSKIDYTFSNGADQGIFIQHNATLSAGNSGGPLVDENGYVVGINKGYVDEYYYSLEIDQVIPMLDMRGIEYELGTGSASTVTPDSSEPSTDVTTETPVVSDNSEVTPVAPTESSSQATVSASTDDDDKDGLNTTTILIIVFAAVAVILIIVIIIVAAGSGKKKVAPTPIAPVPTVPQMPQPVQQPVAPVIPQAPVAQAPVYQDQGGGETTLLNAGAGETSVLGGGAVPAARAMLVRRRNGTNISINRPEFIIGKERNKVNFCVNNNAVSRQHAKITNEGGVYYITDLNSSNYTYVNDVQISPNQPTMLSNGDTIRLADEEFEFRG